jgi:hypothetical protein
VSGTTWTFDAKVTLPLAAGTDYVMTVQLNGTTAMAAVGAVQTSFTFADSLIDGLLGLGTRNGKTHFDNVLVQDQTAPASVVNVVLPGSSSIMLVPADTSEPIHSLKGTSRAKAAKAVQVALDWQYDLPLPSEVARVDASLETLLSSPLDS